MRVQYTNEVFYLIAKVNRYLRTRLVRKFVKSFHVSSEFEDPGWVVKTG